MRLDLERLFTHANKNNIRLGQAAKELYDGNKEILQEAIHYRCAVALDAEYWAGLKICEQRLKSAS